MSTLGNIGKGILAMTALFVGLGITIGILHFLVVCFGKLLGSIIFTILFGGIFIGWLESS